MALADSRVICEYLDDRAGGTLFPKSQTQRRRALVDQSIGDGILTAALLSRYEMAVRPPEKVWQQWLDGQFDKVETSIAAIEKAVPTLGDRVDIGTISFACAFGYLDLRFPDFGWRSLIRNAPHGLPASGHPHRCRRRAILLAESGCSYLELQPASVERSGVNGVQGWV
ncbi:glutathione S-transferase family protein [Bradyrhizobium lupini]|uniref:glutathione S-transferase family protein n=1 Tax=Rhizobium lupini TaxID=136996 RepID=UPI00366BC222